MDSSTESPAPTDQFHIDLAEWVRVKSVDGTDEEKRQREEKLWKLNTPLSEPETARLPTLHAITPKVLRQELLQWAFPLNGDSKLKSNKYITDAIGGYQPFVKFMRLVRDRSEDKTARNVLSASVDPKEDGGRMKTHLEHGLCKMCTDLETPDSGVWLYLIWLFRAFWNLHLEDRLEIIALVGYGVVVVIRIFVELTHCRFQTPKSWPEGNARLRTRLPLDQVKDVFELQDGLCCKLSICPLNLRADDTKETADWVKLVRGETHKMFVLAVASLRAIACPCVAPADTCVCSMYSEAQKNHRGVPGETCGCTGLECKCRLVTTGRGDATCWVRLKVISQEYPNLLVELAVAAKKLGLGHLYCLVACNKSKEAALAVLRCQLALEKAEVELAVAISGLGPLLPHISVAEAFYKREDARVHLDNAILERGWSMSFLWDKKGLSGVFEEGLPENERADLVRVLRASTLFSHFTCHVAAERVAEGLGADTKFVDRTFNTEVLKRVDGVHLDRVNSGGVAGYLFPGLFPKASYRRSDKHEEAAVSHAKLAVTQAEASLDFARREMQQSEYLVKRSSYETLSDKLLSWQRCKAEVSKASTQLVLARYELRASRLLFRMAKLNQDEPEEAESDQDAPKKKKRKP